MSSSTLVFSFAPLILILPPPRSGKAGDAPALQIFRKVSGVFLQNFNGSKIVLSSSRGQGNFRGLEASRLRTLKCVFEDSTSAYFKTKISSNALRKLRLENLWKLRTAIINRPMRLQLIICHKKELLSSIKLVLIRSKCY